MSRICSLIVRLSLVLSDMKSKLICILTVYNAAWSGVVPIATHGPDNQVGSIRVLKAPTGEGTYILKEQVHPQSSNPLRTPSIITTLLPMTSPHYLPTPSNS